MNGITELKALVDRHITDVALWFGNQQSECKTIEDVDSLFATAHKRTEEGLAALKELTVSAEHKEDLHFVRTMFERQVAVYNNGAKRNYKKSIKLAKRCEKLAFAYERRIKGK